MTRHFKNEFFQAINIAADTANPQTTFFLFFQRFYSKKLTVSENNGNLKYLHTQLEKSKCFP